ncbi:MAG: ribosome-associated translation inhibitor RaiA [Candidatus Liptonbacteria bacterium]|nr:ribosome-associated translation inhibitor RaiA [Candidatus Liptonbacteria bacterium]
MNIKLKYTDLAPTEAIRAYAEEKFGMLGKIMIHLDPEGTADLYIDLAHTTRHHQKGNIFAVKANLTIPKKSFQVNEEAENLYSAIDMAKDTLHRSLEKFKDLKIERR